MAVQFDPNKKPDDQIADSNNNGSETVLSKESSTANASPSSSSTSSNAPGTSSGSFTNLQNYISANADQGFGGQVASKVQGAVDAASDAQNKAKSGFEGQIDQNSVKYDQGLVDKAVADPNAVANSQPDYDSFVKQRDASYTGPNNFTDDTQDYSAAQTATDKASQTADASDTEGGRYSLLDQFYGRPTYGQGEKSLDNLLIQNDPNARDAFATTKANAAATKSNFDTLGQQLSDYATAAKAGTADAAAKTKAALFGDGGTGTNITGGAIGSFNDDLTAKYNKAIQDKAAAYSQFSNDIQNNTLSEDELKQIGLAQGTRLYNLPSALNSDRYLTAASDPTKNQVATQDDYARAAALSKLGDIENTFVPDASQVGTYDPSKAVTFNSDILGKDITSGASAYADAMNKARFAGTGMGGLSAADGVNNPFVNGGNTLASQLAAAEAKQQYINQMDKLGGYAGEDSDKANIASIENLVKQIQQQTGYNNTLGGTQPLSKTAPRIIYAPKK